MPTDLKNEDKKLDAHTTLVVNCHQGKVAGILSDKTSPCFGIGGDTSYCVTMWELYSILF